MNREQLFDILQKAFPQAEVEVMGQSGKFDVRVVDDIFEGKKTVARQQQVYAALNDLITSGAVHAVSIRAMTVEEWRKASLFG